MDRRDLREQNRVSWNAVIGAHDSHRGDLSRFFGEGGSTLFQEERDLLGKLEGTSLVHLQCNSGGDSISLARLGATVTGVDLSDEAVSRPEISRRKPAHGLPSSTPTCTDGWRKHHAKAGVSTSFSPPTVSSAGYPTSDAGPGVSPTF